jgi:hypothetical protein
MRYDKRRLPQHRVVVKLLKDARARYDRAKTTAEIEKLRPRVSATIDDVQARIAAIDRWGDSSYLLKDYDAVVGILTDPYPQAKVAAFKGDPQVLEKLRADLDAHTAKIAERLEEVENEKESY